MGNIFGTFLETMRIRHYSKFCDKLIREYESSSSKTRGLGYNQSEGIMAHEVVEAYLERSLRE